MIPYTKPFFLIAAMLLLAPTSIAAEDHQDTDLFVCPDDTVCTSYTDGCNTCSAPDGNNALAACTEMHCPCYDDGSCVLKCLDNDLCVPTDSNVITEVDCIPDPEGNENCPVAKCAAPPQGCDYIFDHYVLNERGVCCASLCYAVDGNGKHCSFEPPATPTDSGNATTVNPDFQVGAACNPPTAMARQGTATSTENWLDFCSVAGCPPELEDCGYVFEDWKINEEGTCCPTSSHAVDKEGNKVDGTVTVGNESPSGAIRNGLWLASAGLFSVLLLGKI